MARASRPENAAAVPAVTVPTSSEERGLAPNLERGLAILEYLAKQPSGRTIQELSAQLEVAPASILRITRVLDSLGYLQRDGASKRFTLTRKFLLLGQPSGSDRSLSECSIEAMRMLRDATSETVQLCCLTETRMVILDQLLATHAFKYSGEIGASCPCYSCAPGKAIMAFLPPVAQTRTLDQIQFKRFTPTTIATRAEMVRELATIRECGYALDRAEGMEGVHCVAAPILDSHGCAVASITISGPSSRLPVSRFPELAETVKQACAAASQRFRA